MSEDLNVGEGGVDGVETAVPVEGDAFGAREMPGAVSGLADRHLVDGAVNLVGWTAHETSYWFRRLQTGLVQNYALLMLFGIFAFVSIYLIAR